MDAEDKNGSKNGPWTRNDLDHDENLLVDYKRYQDDHRLSRNPWKPEPGPESGTSDDDGHQL